MKRWMGTSNACLGSDMVHMDDGRQHQFQTAVISFPSEYLQELRITMAKKTWCLESSIIE